MEEEISLSQIAFALQSIENTQDSVVKASQLMLTFGASDTAQIPTIINNWATIFDEHIINNEGAKKLLAMLYVTNDVLQKCKLQKSEKFIEQFKNVLPAKFQSFYDYHFTTPKFKLEVIKMLNIWKQRRLYPNEYLTQISPQQQVPQIQNQKENQMMPEIIKTPTKQQFNTDDNNLMMTELSENLINIPKDLITFAQAQKDLIKWQEKSKEFETKLKAATKKTVETQFMLEELKRSEELQQKYRTLMLRSVADILQSDDVGHLKMVLELKKIGQRKKEFSEIEEQIAQMETTIEQQ